MIKLFASLYLFVVISMIGLAALVDNLLQPNEEQPKHLPFLANSLAKINNPQLVKALALEHGAKFSMVPATEFRLPASALETLQSKNYLILYDSEQGPQILLNHDSEQFIQLYFSPEKPSDYQFVLYSAVFFILLGVALAIWTWPLWRDIRKLEKAAGNLHEDGSLSPPNLAPSSNLYSIASALEKLSNQVRSLLEARRELSGAIAHEFRTPLARLKFAMEMLDETNNHQIQGMQLDVEELENLVQEMLDYSALEQATPHLAMSEIKMHELCDNLQKKFAMNHPVIEITVKGQNPTLMADGHFIERALQNILQNACKYAKNKILITIFEDETEITVSIADDGPGILIEDRKKIFEPFFRPDSSRNRGSGGVGLGLAIVARVMSWHNGKVQVLESELGGAEFLLIFPTINSNVEQQS